MPLPLDTIFPFEKTFSTDDVFQKVATIRCFLFIHDDSELIEY